MEAADVEAHFAQSIVGDYDSDAQWAAIRALRMDGNREIFERAAAWCCSEDALKRARGANILCQLRRASTAPMQSGEPMFRDESYELITKMLDGEHDLIALESEISALGHLGKEAAIPLILRYLDHADRNIRFAVTCALGSFPNDSESVRGLLKLTFDSDAEVRDWAVFAIGRQGDLDSDEIRDRLLRCLDDPDENVREEAAVGLGKRGDLRLLPKLLGMFTEVDPKVRVAEAAIALLGMEADPPEWVSVDYVAALNNKFS